MSNRQERAETHVANQAVQNSVLYGQHRGAVKMEQYLENWQIVFDNASESHIIDGLTSTEALVDAPTVPEVGGVRRFYST